MGKDRPRPPGPPAGFPFPGGPPQPLPDDPAPAGDGAAIGEFLGMLGGLASAWALLFGATHWGWWTLAGLSILCLTVSLWKKYRRIRKLDEPLELPRAGSKKSAHRKGRKLSAPESEDN